MEVVMHDAKKISLHLITILTLLDKDQQRVACKSLLNQSCTDKGLTSWDIVQILGHPMSKGDKQTFTTTAGIFTANEILQMSGKIHPFLSMKSTFTIKLMVVPKQFSLDLSYGMIIGHK